MDVFRAVLAIGVTFGHIWVLYVQDYAPTRALIDRALYGLGGFAHASVIMFFVLSGYWITRSVVSRSELSWSWATYLGDRVGRIAAVLIPALILGGLLDALGVWALRSPTHLGETGSWVLRKDVAADLSMVTLWGNLLFLEGILVNTFGTNGPLWSLAVEFWLYLWFPALWLLLKHDRPSWALMSLALALVAPKLLFYFLVWLCGSSVYMLQRRAERAGPTSRSARILVLALSTMVLCAALVAARLCASEPNDLVLAIAFALFLLALLAIQPRFVGGLRYIARFGARGSFSLYATHFPVIAFIAAFAVGDRRLAPNGHGLLIVIASLSLTVVTSLAFARLTEEYTSDIRMWLRRHLPGRGSRRRVDPAAQFGSNWTR